MEYSDLILDVDRMCADIASLYSRHLVCRPGCSGCCQHDVSVFEVEAAELQSAYDRLPDEIRREVKLQAEHAAAAAQRNKDAHCPFLVADRCAAYEYRPVICRTQGLPILYVAEDGTLEVDFCRLNFAAPGATGCLEEKGLVPLEELNEKLVLANLSHCAARGYSKARSGRRIKMSDLILQFPSSGVRP